MQPLTVVDSAQLVTFKVKPNPELMFELKQLPYRGRLKRLPDIVQGEYEWISQENQRLALEHTESLVLASEMELSLQADMNYEKVYEVLTQDMAETLFQLARLQLNYAGEIQVYRGFLRPVGRGYQHRRRIKTDGDWILEWVFYPLHEFNREIPLQALKAKKMVSNACIVQPEAYWVADMQKRQAVQYQSSSFNSTWTSTRLDPILCGQYGNWLAGIAMWL